MLHQNVSCVHADPCRSSHVQSKVIILVVVGLFTSLVKPGPPGRDTWYKCCLAVESAYCLPASLSCELTDNIWVIGMKHWSPHCVGILAHKSMLLQNVSALIDPIWRDNLINKSPHYTRMCRLCSQQHRTCTHTRTHTRTPTRARANTPQRNTTHIQVLLSY